MTTRYVSSAHGSNSSPYASLAAAATALSSAVSGSAAGTLFAIDSAQSESLGASTTYTFPGTVASPNQIYSFNTSGTTLGSGDLLAGATYSASNGFGFTFGGTFYAYGLNVSVGGGGASTASITIGGNTLYQRWDTCTFNLNNSSASSVLTMNNGGSTIIDFENTTIQFGATGQSIITRGGWKWRNTASAIPGATLPTTLVGTAALSYGEILIEGVDLSALGSGKTIIGANNGVVHVKDCKINASVTLAATPSTVEKGPYYFSRIDSSGTTNVFDKYAYAGTESNTTSIYRSGGAAAFDGTGFSKKIVTTGNALLVIPFEAIPMMEVNTLTGSTRTVTVYGTLDAAAVPTNAQIWMEVEYPQDSGDPLGGYVSSGIANLLTTGSNLMSDGVSTWNGISGFSNTGGAPFKMSVTLTAELEGPLTVRIYAAEASTAFYIDAIPVFS